MQSRWFRKARIALGLNVPEMAELIQVNSRTINAWENEKNINLPSRDHMLQYISLLAGDRVLRDPVHLLKTRSPPSGDETLHSHLGLTHIFTRLNSRSRFMVNRMIRSIYSSEKLLNSSEDKNEQVSGVMWYAILPENNRIFSRDFYD